LLSTPSKKVILNQFNLTHPMNAIIYCRVSSKEQIEGTSLESQQAACREYAQSKNIEVLKAFIEQGESAKFADRTQLVELIDFCRRNKGTVDALLVWKVDRFARNVADHFSVKATLGKYGVRIVSVTEPIDANPEGKLMETILAGFAQFDNDLRATRTVQGMRRKLQEGIFPWGPPFGYKSSVTGNEKKTLPDLPNEPAFSLLRKAFAECATGAHTQAEMGRLMESWGLVGAHGKSFAPQSLYQLFTNPFYAGILVDPWSGEEFHGKHAPLVTQEKFAQVQRVIAARNRSVAHRKEREEFPLRAFVRCDACGHGLTAAFSRGRNSSYPYYLCSQRECTRRGKSLPAAEVHCEFTSFLDEIAPRQELVHEIGESVIKMAEQGERDRSAQRQRRRKRIGELETEINGLIRMRAQDLITNEEFLMQKKRLADQRMALETQTGQSTDLAQVRADLQQITEPLSALRATWKSLKPASRSRFDRLVLPGGFVSGNIRTADMGLLFSTFRASTTGVSSGVPLPCVRSNRIISEIHELREILCDTGGIIEESRVAVRR
jgi:site-specific DNA recombinase